MKHRAISCSSHPSPGHRRPHGRLRVWDAATGQELWNQTAVTLWWQEDTAGEE